MELWPCVVVGAGAAGYFAVSELIRLCPDLRILHLEKSDKVLAKVRISGGGRCNLTHHCPEPEHLLSFYPRGNPWLRPVFERFAVRQTLEWFHGRGLATKVESDGRMFPQSDSSESVIQVLEKAARGPGVERRLRCGLSRLEKNGSDGFSLTLSTGEQIRARTVILASGGSPGAGGLSYLSGLNIPRVDPVPSLFTFNLKPHPWKPLMGVSLPKATVSLPGFDLSATGPLLVTHWGLSGPAVLRLSAFGARLLQESGYRYTVRLSLIPDQDLRSVLSLLSTLQSAHPKKKPNQVPLEGIPKRLWEVLCTEAGLDRFFNWAEAGKKEKEALARSLTSRQFEAEGKTTFKEEFVTAGGISLEAVDPNTCGIRAYPGLFATGEVLDVDGVTGGFNFQAAWSTAHCAALGASAILKN